MRNKLKTRPGEPEVKADKVESRDECVHYWLIDSPHGPISRGVCRFCGAEKEFSNSPPEFMLSRRQNTNLEELPALGESEVNGEKKTEEASE